MPQKLKAETELKIKRNSVVTWVSKTHSAKMVFGGIVGGAIDSLPSGASSRSEHIVTRCIPVINAYTYADVKLFNANNQTTSR